LSDVNRELVERFAAALRDGNTADAARCFHRQYRSNSWGGDLAQTWKRMQAWAAAGAISDENVTARHILSEGDRVVSHVAFSAIHSGEFLGVPPTGRRFEFHSIEMWRVQDGKLIEHWGGIREAVRLHEQLTQ
jgi:predicted ester cyclase